MRSWSVRSWPAAKDVSLAWPGATSQLRIEREGAKSAAVADRATQMYPEGPSVHECLV